MLPSGAEAIIDNRVRWARFHLKKAGVFNDPQRGQFQITKRGLDLLEKKPSEINMKVLEQYEEYRSIKNQLQILRKKHLKLSIYKMKLKSHQKNQLILVTNN